MMVIPAIKDNNNNVDDVYADDGNDDVDDDDGDDGVYKTW